MDHACACGRKLADPREAEIIKRLETIRKRRVTLVAEATPDTYERVVITLRRLGDEVEELRCELGALRRERPGKL